MNDEPLLRLKFWGETLDVRSVPIYELGETLVAVQRIIHKTYLVEAERLKRHSRVRNHERERLSLQISGREKSSDIYALVPFAADPAVRQHLTMLLKLGLGVLTKYASSSVLPSEEEEDTNISVNARTAKDSLLAGAIYGDVYQITNNILNIGGVEGIELMPNKKIGAAPIELNSDTKQYVRKLLNATYRGPKQEITGVVTSLSPNRFVSEVRLKSGRTIKVRLSPECFNFVRYETQPKEFLRFKGHPIMRLGKEKTTYDEFEAESVTPATAKH